MVSEAISDADCVRKLQRGDTDAFETLIRRHQKTIFNLVYRMLGDYDEAAEISQEVFLSAWRNLSGFRGEAALSTWLLRIAANRCLNRIRRRKSLSEREAPWPEPSGEAEEGFLFQPPGGEADRPDLLAETCEMREILTEALSRLDPGSRWMVLLSDVEGFSYEEIASLAEVPVGTVKSRLHRARMAMRRLLSPVA